MLLLSDSGNFVPSGLNRRFSLCRTGYLLMIMGLVFSSCKERKMILKWSLTATIPSQPNTGQSIGIAGPVTGICNNYLLVGGGANFPGRLPWLGGHKVYYKNVFVYRIADRNLTYEGHTFELPEPIAYGANASSPKGICVVGGENDNGPSSHVYLITGTIKDFKTIGLPDYPVAVTNACAVVIGNTLYVVGGETRDAVTAALYKLDLDYTERGWEPLASLPHSASHGMIVATEEGFYFMGGRCKGIGGVSTLYSDVYYYSVPENSWTTRKKLPYVLSAGAGGMYVDGKIVLLSGDRGDRFHATEEIIHAINDQSDPQVKNRLTQEKIHLQETHPGFSKDVLLFTPTDNSWKVCDSIPFPVPCTTSAVQAGSCMYIPSGEIRAGVRTPSILRLEVKK